MARAIWKGSISFGLVSIPVALQPAEHPVKVFEVLLVNRRQPVSGSRLRKRFRAALGR